MASLHSPTQSESIGGPVKIAPKAFVPIRPAMRPLRPKVTPPLRPKEPTVCIRTQSSLSSRSGTPLSNTPPPDSICSPALHAVVAHGVSPRAILKATDNKQRPITVSPSCLISKPACKPKLKATLKKVDTSALHRTLNTEGLPSPPLSIEEPTLDSPDSVSTSECASLFTSECFEKLEASNMWPGLANEALDVLGAVHSDSEEHPLLNLDPLEFFEPASDAHFLLD